MANDEPTRPPHPRRERSTRYPGASLAEVEELCRFVADKGLDGLSAAGIAASLGYKNIKTNTFSARLSSARQFGLLALEEDGYALTPLARSLLQATGPDLARLRRQAFSTPPLYADLAARLASKRLPEAAILANVLQHSHGITASAKQGAAEAFLESARFAGVLGADLVFRPEGPAVEPSPDPGPGPARPTAPAAGSTVVRPTTGAEVRLALRLWDEDHGKVIRVRAPESISRASFERFVQAFRLLVRVEGPREPGADEARDAGP